MKKLKRSFQILICSLLCLASILLVFLVVLGFNFCLFFLGGTEGIEEKREIFGHNYYQTNITGGSSSVGLVTLYNQLGNDEYISKRVGDSYILISNFETDEFKCTGNCECMESDENRRISSTTTVVKSVYFLVAALSSIIAINKAQEVLEEECKDVLEDDCEPAKIKTKLSDCERGSARLGGDDDLEYDESNPRYRRYMCKGQCLPKIFKGNQLRGVALDFDCSNYGSSGEVEYYKKENGYGDTFIACMIFQRDILHPYCKETTEESYFHRKMDGKSEWRSINVCVGSHYMQNNPTITCRTTS